jgi:hypothetical protein
VVPPTASTSTAASSVPSAATPPAKPKIDIKKMFQSPSSAPSSNPPSDTLSPSMRNVGLPTQQQQPHQSSNTRRNPAYVPQRLHNHTRMRDSRLIFGFDNLNLLEHFSVIFTFRYLNAQVALRQLGAT